MGYATYTPNAKLPQVLMRVRSETATDSMVGATRFGSGAGGSFLGFAALQRGKCAVSCIHPNGPFSPDTGSNADPSCFDGVQ
jgi:hypothetical protein